jgi:hypothetical protein
MSDLKISLGEQIFNDYCLGTLTPYENFMMALKSKETKRQYPKLLKMFLDFIKLDDSLTFENRVNLLYEKSINEKNWLATNTFRYILFHEKRVERREIVAGTLKNHVKVVRVFCRMNDIENLVPWNKIKITMPKIRQFADDRAPTLEEISKLVEFNDPRIRPLVYLMSSSGIRLGAIDYLRWKYIVPIYDDDDPTKVIAAKLIVYPGEPEQYYTFITPEAYSSLLNWINFRKSHGELVTGESWVFRNLWETRNIRFSELNKLASNPIRFGSTGVKTMLSRAWHIQGVWSELKDGKKRHDFKLAHGFRKFFETQTQKVMNHNNVKILMGHSASMGLSKNYYKPTEKDVLLDYLKAISLLTIEEENKLKEELSSYKERNKEQNYIITGKLLDKDNEIKRLNEQVDSLSSKFENMINNLNKITDQNSLNTIAQSMYSSGLIIRMDQKLQN